MVFIRIATVLEKEETFMTDTVVEALIVDLLEWLAKGDRRYEEVMDAWRTSCPKLPVWEDASDRGLVTRVRVNGQPIVRITPLGLALLAQPKFAAAKAPRSATYSDTVNR